MIFKRNEHCKHTLNEVSEEEQKGLEVAGSELAPANFLVQLRAERFHSFVLDFLQSQLQNFLPVPFVLVVNELVLDPTEHQAMIWPLPSTLSGGIDP